MIYFIQDSGNCNIKIGFAANDADARRATLQTGNSSRLVLLGTMPGELSDEQAMHDRFRNHRVTGEWFLPHPDVLAFILTAATRALESAARATAKHPWRLQPVARGFWVAMTLKAGTAPLRSYVGQVQAVSGRGVRITLIDWVVGTACGLDLYVPWSNVESMLVCTPDHDVSDFGERARLWQQQMEGGET